MSNSDSSSNEDISPAQVGGAFADGLTLIRILATPIIMAIIFFYWPETQMAVFASILFIIAALTDIFDDYFGGSARAQHRKFGWADDAADTVLVVGTLLALIAVIYREGLLFWPFLIPACILIFREIFIGLIKGFEISRYGWSDTFLGNTKSGLSMLAVCILVGSPWLTLAFDKYRADETNVMDVFNSSSPWIWGVGQGILWLAALLSVITAFQILRNPELKEQTVEADITE
jgi:phosphatidylglycerophosphate synthase